MLADQCAVLLQCALRHGSVLLLAFCASVATAADRVQFNRDIRPILADKCFLCHGPDQNSRQADLRLDVREAALEHQAIVPGQPQLSLLIERVLTKDPERVMPPPDSQKQLSPQQQQLLQQWIEEGAEYQLHWAYEPPVKPPVPTAGGPPADSSHPVDAFIQARLAEDGLSLSPAASRETLIRRVTLDLTGLPPTPDEVDAFLSDAAPAAYERLVERLLSSPHYGERMAVDWLDAARYADSNGYQVDRDRELWAWRDWVIRAFNDNLPFDQFTIEQLAGDLLPEPTREQRIATGFHRNHMLNEEGGIIPEEFLAEYTADRVETTAAVWLGQTLNCARCHDHKYDPFTQRDFYALKAFFHNVPESGVGNYGKPIRENAPPFLKLPTPELEARLEQLRADLVTAQQQLAAVTGQAAPGTQPAPAPANTEPGSQTEQQRLGELVKSLQQQIATTEAEIPTTLVMAELPEPRETFVLRRGAYDQPGERVSADTPAVLPALPSDLPRNRLGLARWLVSPRNPLTARVTVNRFWQQLFGTGLVATSEDFGSQGTLPSHPELLDWLAVTFQESGWDVKRLMQLLVTSAAYRQQSHCTPQLLEHDPQNRLLARGPRFRLPAEMIRDQALAASGLLVRTIGGRSVRPYHPPGLYEQVTAGTGTNVYVPGQATP